MVREFTYCLELGFRTGGKLENVSPKKGIKDAYLIADR